MNLLISALSMTLGSITGLLLGLGRVSPTRLVRHSTWLIVQIFRNSPWLVLLFFCMFLLPFKLDIVGRSIPFPDWVKATLGFALPIMANFAEIVRGAFQSIPRTQREAAEALGCSRFQCFRYVILPQAVKRMLPPWMSLYALVTVSTPLASIVGVEEAVTYTRVALAAEPRHELLLPMYAFVLVWFFLYVYPIGRWTTILERRFGIKGVRA